jgi:spore photoproduct lyase
MKMEENYLLAEEIDKRIREALPVRLGVNKRNELLRLVYEICVSRERSAEEVLLRAGFYVTEGEDKGGLFHKLKKELIRIRYELFREGDKLRLMPLKLENGRKECSVWNEKLDPGHIFVEEQVAGCDWTRKLISHFPKARVSEVKAISEARGEVSAEDITDRYNVRRENILITSNKSSFVKICPCTKNAKRCGYWILNLGFGCPFDCSYCYLQTYSNVPGLVLVANIEDYYRPIKDLDASASGKKIRIGTGEFTDSLALDRYTGYAGKLIRVFRETSNLVLELKTKTSEIGGILEETPHDNVVISWSINTPRVAEKYEKGASPVPERVEAAFLAAKKGYALGFHFDPVVWYRGWESEYEDTIRDLFSRREIAKKTRWISIGTLRYSPGLKQAAEQRFGDNRIFYDGDFFLDFDGKFRYPERLRRDIYGKVAGLIRNCGVSCWIYLCMEPADMSVSGCDHGGEAEAYGHITRGGLRHEAV